MRANKTYGGATPYREGAYSNLMWTAADMYADVAGSSNITADNVFLIDRFVEDGSFLRCDNITLGYTFNKPKIKARIYATVSNPFIITRYTGIDPEVPITVDASGVATSGIDRDVYPRSMTVLCGLSLSF